jgi:hypothetical protein
VEEANLMKKVLLIGVLILAAVVTMMLRNRRAGSDASWHDMAESAKDAASKVSDSVKDAVTTTTGKVADAVDVAKEKAKNAAP